MLNEFGALSDTAGTTGAQLRVGVSETWVSVNAKTRVVHAHPQLLTLPTHVQNACLAHELGHLQGRHAGKRHLADLAAALLALTLAYLTASQLGLLAAVAVELALFCLWMLGEKVLARAQEHDADKRAGHLLEQAGLSEHGHADMAEALLASAEMRAVLPARRLPRRPGMRAEMTALISAAGRSLWAEHPPIHERVARLQQR